MRFNSGHATSPGSRGGEGAKNMLLGECCSLLVGLLVSCGSSLPASTGVRPTASPRLTATSGLAASPTPTLSPPSPTPVPPEPTSAPTQPPSPPAQLLLNVAPGSMSIVGHLHCSKSDGAFHCQAAVFAEAGDTGSF